MMIDVIDPRVRQARREKEIHIETLRTKLNRNCFSVNLKNAFISKTEKEGFGSKISKQIPYYIIMPYGSRRLAWDSFLAIVIIYQFLFIPIDIGFNKECIFTEETVQIFTNLNIVTYFIFAFDILINFFTALVDEKGIYIYELYSISISYLTSFFIIDLAIIVPLDLIIPFDDSSCFKPGISVNKIMLLLRYLRIHKISRLNSIIEKFTPAKYIGYIRLIKLLAGYFYLIYFFGFFFVSNSQSILDSLEEITNDYQKTADNFSWLFSYCILIGVFLVLGNDLNLSQSYERGIIIFINIVSLIANGYVFGYVANSLKNNIGGEVDIATELEKIKEFMMFHDFSEELTLKINKFYTIMYKRQRDLYENEPIFSNLSDILQIHAKFEMWKDLYFNIDQFFVSQDISSEFFGDALYYMKAKMYESKERIINEGEKSNDFYFITSGGKCNVHIHGVVVNVLQEGNSFGEISIFLNSGRRTASVSTINITDLIYIPGRDFLKLLRNHPREAGYIKNIAISSFYRTISMTRVDFASRLFGGDNIQTIFKVDLYRNSNESWIGPHENWNVTSVEKIMNNLKKGLI